MSNRIENWTGVPLFIVVATGGKAHMTRGLGGPYFHTYCGKSGMSQDAMVVTDRHLDVCDSCARVAESREGCL